jgi:hypothetical protein
MQFHSKTYDYFKYKGKTNVKLESFEKRNDKYFFSKLSKHSDPINYLVANFINQPDFWIGDFETTSKIYNDWLKRQQSLTYIFSQELSTLNNDFNSNFIIQNHQHPYIFKLFLQNKLSIETIIILFDLTDYWSYISKKLEQDMLWQEQELKLKKYLPFVKFDRKKYTKIIKTKFSNNKRQENGNN